jgi:serine/threonine-protein kinase HipA
LRCQPSGRTGDILSFAYHDAWLQRAETFAFDPDLNLVPGPQYPSPGHAAFVMFLDSSPDRWGRVLMQRRENLHARAEKRPPAALTEWDFLLGVHDETRLGALRFRAEANAPFLDDDPVHPAPPLTSLAAVQDASLNFEAHIDEEDRSEYLQWLAQLFEPGTSLGGARPKASVRDESNALCIAKFPSRSDTRDIGAWEIVAHRLAARAGIDVPDARSLRLGGNPYTTFVARRFDRTATGRRLAFVSAMTIT